MKNRYLDKVLRFLSVSITTKLDTLTLDIARTYHHISQKIYSIVEGNRFPRITFPINVDSVELEFRLKAI